MIGALFGTIFRFCFEKFHDALDYIFDQFDYFLRLVLLFPALTDDPVYDESRIKLRSFPGAYPLERPFFGSRRNSLNVMMWCFGVNFILIVVGALVWYANIELFHFLSIYPYDFEVIAPGEKMYNTPKINIPYESLVSPILKLICTFLLFISAIFILFIIFIIFLQFLIGILSSLLYLLELFLFVRKKIMLSTLEKNKSELQVFDRQDMLFLLFIVSLLAFPFASVIFICYILPGLIGFVYIEFFGTILKGLFPFIVNYFTVSVLWGVHDLTIEIFQIQSYTGYPVRIWIGTFWMLISLSIFNYQPEFLEKDNHHIHIDFPNFTEDLIEEPSELNYGISPSFIRAFATFFLLLFSPIIMLAVVYTLQQTVFEFPFPLPDLPEIFY